MSEHIQHEGIVLSAEADKVRVRLVQSSACAECKAHAMCTSAEGREHEVVALTSEPMQAGDRVEVTETRSMGWTAVAVAYILPVVVLIGILAALSLNHVREEIAGTAALCAAGVYFIVLSLFRNRLENRFHFRARRIY